DLCRRRHRGLSKCTASNFSRQGNSEAHERGEPRHHFAVELRRMRSRAASSALSLRGGDRSVGRSRTIGAKMVIPKSGLGVEPTGSTPNAIKLALLGTMGGTHIGGSLTRGAAKLGIKSILFDAEQAAAGPRLLRSLSWHLDDRRPLHLNRFSNELV